MKKKGNKHTVASSKLYASLLPKVLTRSERTRIQIIEAAIRCYASIGMDNTTYEKIAAVCKVSRPLVIYHFPDYEKLALSTFRYVRANMQEFAVNAIESKQTSAEQFIAYVESVFQWTVKYEQHFKVWLLFYYFCGINPQFNEIHTELVTIGHQRIAILINQLRKNNLPQEELMVRAKMIQVLITGAMVSCGVEKLPLSLKDFTHAVTEECLQIAKR
jgi:AcrR family transcriptional regulator